MPVVKIVPPTQLPDRGLTEHKFSVWRTQLKAWLNSDDSMALFMPRGRYNTWQPEEINPDRIVQLVNPGDTEIPQDATEDQLADLLDKRRRQLDIFISQIANTVSVNMYTVVTRHATSLD